ncbi:MAG TPA: hypothetical protein VHM19_15325, partial [Polyangiales bacterium]|nr:hypothetical protein [Polyangiales bacterium]
ALTSGRPAVTVKNPSPAGCSVARADVLTVPPALSVTSQPLNVCQNVASTTFPLQVVGDGMLRVDSSDFTVKFNGSVVTPSSFDGCTALAVADGTNVSSCTGVHLSVDLTGLTSVVGTGIPIEVDNAAAGCPSTASTMLNVVAPPTVSNVSVAGSSSPHDACSDTVFTLDITGTGFVAGTVVKLANDNDVFTATAVNVMSSTMLSADFAGLPYDATDPTYNLVVETAGSCASAPLVDLITIDPTPLVFFVDPPIVYNSLSIDATVFTSGLSASSALDKIELIGPASSGSPTTTELAVISNPKPNRIVARIPGIDSGTSQPTFAAGDYAVRVTSTLGCVGTLDGGVKLTDTLDGSLLTAIDPNFVSRTQPTAVTVTGSGFLAVPRLYLTPSGSSGNATALRSVEVVSGTKLTAVIPGDITTPLTADTYDLVAVNPDGKVDVLANAVTVTSNEPPVIDSVVPASLVNTGTGTVAVHGTGFDVMQVSLVCKPPGGGANVTVTGTVQGTPTTTDASASFNVGASGASAGSICLVHLLNNDGSSFDYSAISLTNSSLNLSPWSAGTDMVVPRRALSLAAGRPTNTSRFLYAIGGDSGAASNTQTLGTVFDSTESANVDVFGTIGSWSLQRNDLSHTVIGGTAVDAPRTAAASARVGRFVYLVGGHESNSSAATDTLLRAEVLDPLATPEITDLDAQLGNVELNMPGLTGGLYYYRVAAIFTDGDASNPGGESLPGELLPVQVPSRSEGVQLILTWAPIPGAHGYRIYRSPAANASADAIELLTEKTCGNTGADLCDCVATPSQCKVTDDGNFTTMAGKTPLPSGSLGVWHAVDGARCTSGDCKLGTARESEAVVAVKDPSNAAQYFLYAIGGRDAAGTYLDTYEVATITVAGSGAQTVADFTAGGDTLSSPRAELGAWVLSAENSAVIRGSGTPNDVWIFIGGGRTTGDGFDRALEAGLVQAGGGLSNFTATDPLKGDLAGFGAGASNGQLYTFGGKSGAADGTSAQLCAGGGGCAGLPDLQPGAFNALGSATTQRMYTAATQESAFFFLAGGHDGTQTLATTERTVQ